MTYFSIHKSLRTASLLLIAAVVLSVSAFSVKAQTELPADVLAAEMKKEQEDKDKKSGKVGSPIVIELFTTADCSACVFADRMLYDAIQDKQVIALSCYVEDMNGLRSQKDSEASLGASPRKGPMDPCVFRQWTYKSNYRQDVTINIPHFIFNGEQEINADSPAFFNQMLRNFHYSGTNKTLEVFLRWKDDNTISIHLPQDTQRQKAGESASIWIIRYKDIEVQKVDEGINKGRVLRFSNTIQDIRHIGKWHGQTRSLDVDVAKPQGGKERGGYAVLVQEMMGRPILAAGKLPDYPHPNDLKKPAPAAPTPAPAVPTAPLPAQ